MGCSKDKYQQLVQEGNTDLAYRYEYANHLEDLMGRSFEECGYTYSDCEKEADDCCKQEAIEFFEKKFEDNMSEAQKRKAMPVFSGVLKYFPDALKEVAKCSKAGNDQHNPNQPLFWDRTKSKDELDALTRHLIDHSVDPVDTDGVLHLAKVSWRALAALQKYLEGQDI